MISKKRKLQQYYIFKFNTSRLKKYNYNVNINLTDARANGELVSLGDSLLLRSLRHVKGTESDNIENIIDSLLLEKKRLKNRKNSSENSKRILEIDKEVDDRLFVPQIVSIIVDNIRHYEHIIKQGLVVNNHHYVRLLFGAGNARRNTVLLVDQDYEEQLKSILNNKRNIEKVQNSNYCYHRITTNFLFIPLRAKQVGR